MDLNSIGSLLEQIGLPAFCTVSMLYILNTSTARHQEEREQWLNRTQDIVNNFLKEIRENRLDYSKSLDNLRKDIANIRSKK